MKTQVKKTIKIIAITLLSLVLLVAAAITFVIHVVFTPEKLTPIVVRVANQTLDAKLDMKSVELTFFSTFPRFGLKLTDGTLVSKAINDTLWQKTDSLLSFKKCVVVVNPIDYLEKQRISLYYLSLDSISAYAHINKEGKANWDIVKLDTTTTEAESDTAKMQLDAINIRNVFVRHANLTFDDRATQVYADLQDANLHLKASLQRDRTLLALDFDNRNLIFWQEGNLLARRIRTKLSTQLKLDRPTRTLTLKDARVTVNGTELDVQGTLRGDSVQRALDMDLRLSCWTIGLRACKPVWAFTAYAGGSTWQVITSLWESGRSENGNAGIWPAGPGCWCCIAACIRRRSYPWQISCSSPWC